MCCVSPGQAYLTTAKDIFLECQLERIIEYALQSGGRCNDRQVVCMAEGVGLSTLGKDFSPSGSSFPAYSGTIESIEPGESFQLGFHKMSLHPKSTAVEIWAIGGYTYSPGGKRAVSRLRLIQAQVAAAALNS